MSFSSFWVSPTLGFASEPMGAADARRLASMGVTDVLDLRAEALDQSAVYTPVGIHYLRDPMIDDGRHQPVNVYVTGVTFVLNALARGGKVLVHCAAGQYRSPSMVYAVLRTMGYSATDAWSMVLHARATANRQYVASAEAAVPYLPTRGDALAVVAPGRQGPGVIVMLAGVTLAASLGYLAVKWYVDSANQRPARRR